MVATRSSARQAEKRAAEGMLAGEGEPETKRAKPKAKASPKPKPKTTMSAPLVAGQRVDWDISLVEEDGASVRFNELVQDKGAVFFMFPRANTPGCTKQACGFRDRFQDIRDAGFAVYGLGGDSTKTLASWKSKQKLPYKLLSDPKHELIGRLGSSVGGTKVQRSHVVILKGGIVGNVQGHVSPAASVERAVEYVTSLKKEKEKDEDDEDDNAQDEAEKEEESEEEESDDGHAKKAGKEAHSDGEEEEGSSGSA